MFVSDTSPLRDSAVIEVTGHCVIDGGPLRAGVAVKGLLHEQMPIVGNAELDLTEWKLTTKLDIPNEVRGHGTASI